jgi:hypothetical protein
MSKGNSLVCVSTWWHYPNIDDTIKQACEAHDGHYAYIGDIFTDPANPDRQSTTYSDWQTNDHPRNGGMPKSQNGYFNNFKVGRRASPPSPLKPEMAQEKFVVFLRE